MLFYVIYFFGYSSIFLVNSFYYYFPTFINTHISYKKNYGPYGQN